MLEKRDAYVRELKEKLGEWNDEINKLKAKIVDAGEERKAVYNEQLEKMQQKRAELERKIVSLQESGESTWEKVKHGVEESWQDLKQSLESVKARVKGK